MLGGDTISTYYRRKERGLCPFCGKPVNDGHTLCSDCREKQKEYYRRRKKELGKDNLCRFCGKTKVSKGETLCDDCKKYHREFRRRMIKERLEKGLCPGCGKEKGNGYFCPECTRKRVENTIAWTSRNREKGLCPLCGGERQDKNYILCADCRKQYREYY